MSKTSKKSKFKSKTQFINLDFTDEENEIIDMYKDMYNYEGNKVFSIKDATGKMWAKGNDIADIMEYARSRDAIRNNVSINKKIIFTDMEISPSDFKSLPKIDPKTVFIDEAGILELVTKSKMPNAQKFKDWIAYELIPQVIKHGTYSTATKIIDQFYNNNMLASYHKKNVIYLSYVGIHEGEHKLKYGKSTNFVSRELDNHRKDFPIFEVCHIKECDNINEVEKLLKIEWKQMKIDRKNVINGHNYTELIAINHIVTVNKCIDVINKIADETKSKTQLTLENKITQLENENNNLKEIIIAKNETLKSKDKHINNLQELLILAKKSLKPINK